MATVAAIFHSKAEILLTKETYSTLLNIHQFVLAKYVPLGQRLTFGVRTRHRKGVHRLVKSN